MLAFCLIGGFVLFVIDLLTGRRLAKMDTGELFGLLFILALVIGWALK